MSALRNRNAATAAQGQGEGAPETEKAEGEETKPVELTLQGVLNTLLQGSDLVGFLLLDLSNYCLSAAEYLGELSKASPEATLDRKKVNVKESVYSHHEEVEERLEFLKFIAKMTNDFCITKKELGVIYDLLVAKSCMSSDSQEFLTWCKSSCDAQAS